MIRIALVGLENSGKSTLTYAFGNYVRKQGLSCEAANFDSGCKRALYKPAFDVRHYHSLDKRMRTERTSEDETLNSIYAELADDPAAIKSINATRSAVTMMDCRGGAELFLSDGPRLFLGKYADCILLVFDSTQCATEADYGLQEQLAGLLEKATGVKCVAIANKYSSASAPTQTHLFGAFSALPQTAAASDGVLRVNAIEGTGFRELFRKAVVQMTPTTEARRTPV